MIYNLGDTSHTQNKRSGKMRLIPATLIYLAVLAIAINGCSNTTDNKQNPGTTDQEKFAIGSNEEVSDTTIQASTLASTYMRQEEAANQRYKGKTIKVRGVIGRIDMTKEDIPYIEMSGSGGWNIQCIFPSTWHGDAPNLPIGQLGLIKGRVEGVMDDVSTDPSSIFTTAGRRLTLKDCEIAE